MRKTRSSKRRALDPVEKRPAWRRFWSSAWIKVSVSGGPIHDPHKPVLQLLIRPWAGDDESWTVYRHGTRPRDDGKIEFRKWDREADKQRCRELGTGPAPKEWEATVNERHFPVSGQWVKALERALESLSIPPIAGAVQPLSRSTCYELRLWRNRQRSAFEWNPTAPAGWKPISELFFSLLRAFRQHANGRPLAAVSQLYPPRLKTAPSSLDGCASGHGAYTAKRSAA
jgi:hypothetical protein